jgi:tripartite-type tricarboxylate transporter receptor subunit TctC
VFFCFQRTLIGNTLYYATFMKKTLNQFSSAIAEILKQPDVTNRLLEMNFDPVGSTPSAMQSFMVQERVRWRKVIRDSGATAEQ